MGPSSLTGKRRSSFPLRRRLPWRSCIKDAFPCCKALGGVAGAGIGLHLQIGVLGLDVSFLRRLECGLRLWAVSARTLRPERSSRFLPVKAVLWRQNTVISWPCCSWRIVTARVSVRACVRGMFCAFFSLSKQTLGQLLRLFDATHLGIAQLVTAEVIPLAVLSNIPQLAPQALCAVVQPSPDQFLRCGLDPFFQSVLHLGFLFDFIDISHLDPGGGALAPPWFYYAAKSEGLVVISL